MKKNLYWLASYPKSGNTWFRIFLSHYLTNNENIDHLSHLGVMASSMTIIKRYNKNYKRYLDYEDFYSMRRESYIEFNRISNIKNEIKYNKIHDAYDFIIPEEVSGGIIYFIRNPFDVCVSFSNHMGFTNDKSIDKMNDDDFFIGGVKKQLKQNLLSWSNHIKSWTEQDKIPIHIIKYEDMLTNTFNVFSDAIKFLNIEYDEDRIKKSIEFTQFENLKKIEKEKGFKETPKKSDGFFKTGKSNYGKDILTYKQKEILIKNHKEIMIKYNYL